MTPSFNQGQYLEETIRSVLLQGYPDLEYIVVDGGSADESVEVLRKYEPWLAYWVSEPDRGKYHAQNKGFRRATGPILAWLNSDDRYEPGAVGTAATYLLGHPDTAMVYGDALILGGDDQVVDTWKSPPFDLSQLLFTCFIPQPSVFFRRAAFEAAGDFVEDLQIAEDYELWLKIGRVSVVDYHPGFQAAIRFWSGTEMVQRPGAFWPARLTILSRFFSSLPADSPLRKLEAEACAIVHLHDAFHRLKLDQIEEVRQALERAFAMAPGILRLQRERITRMLVAYAGGDSSPSEAKAYLDRVARNLPSNAAATASLYDNALRRICLLGASRGTGGHASLNPWPLILSAILHDRAWCAHPPVRRELAALLLGRGITRALAGWKRRWGGFGLEPYPKGPFGA